MQAGGAREAAFVTFCQVEGTGRYCSLRRPPLGQFLVERLRDVKESLSQVYELGRSASAQLVDGRRQCLDHLLAVTEQEARLRADRHNLRLMVEREAHVRRGAR